MVSHSHAESLLLRGKPEEAARIYSLSNAEFDMVVLRLLNVLPPSTPRCSSSNPEEDAVSGMLSSTIRSCSSSPDSHLSCNAAASAALIQFLTDKLDQLLPCPTPSSEVTLHSSLSMMQPTMSSLCVSIHPSIYLTN